MTAAAAPPLRTLPGQLWRFGLSGLANTALGLALILFSHSVLGLGLLASNLAGYGAGLALSFVLNRGWTFGHDGPVGPVAVRFALVVALAFAANVLLLALLLRAGLPYPLAQGAGVLLYSLLSFVGFRHVVFVARR